MASVVLKLPEPESRPHRVHDPTFYPTEEKVGEDSLQRFILDLLRPLIERWYAELGKPTFVGAAQFIFPPSCEFSKNLRGCLRPGGPRALCRAGSRRAHPLRSRL